MKLIKINLLLIFKSWIFFINVKFVSHSVSRSIIRSSSTILLIGFDHVDDPGKSLLKTKISQAWGFLDSDLASEVTVPCKRQFIANFWVGKGTFHVLLVREDEDWNFCLGCLGHHLV